MERACAGRELLSLYTFFLISVYITRAKRVVNGLRCPVTIATFILVRLRVSVNIVAVCVYVSVRLTFPRRIAR